MGGFFRRRGLVAAAAGELEVRHSSAFQIDQCVGHGDSPDHPDHFIAVNTGGLIEVVELNVMAPKNDHVYPITTAIDPSVPVSLSFRDMNRDGKIDLLVTIGENNPYTVVLLNTGTQFTQ
jgi:hypothetical protein